MRVVWTLEHWANAVVDLPVSGPLPERTILVANERVAHALRCTLVLRHSPEALVGTRFVSPLELARGVLREAGEAAVINELELGPALLRDALSGAEEGGSARERRAERALMHTLLELDSVGADPLAMAASSDRQVRELGRVFEALQRRGELHTTHALFRRAASAVSARPGLCSPTEARSSAGALLAVVSGFESASELAFLRALPDVTWALWAVRPVRREHRDRLIALLGEPFAIAARRMSPRQECASALSHLRANLFEPEREGAAPKDESVRIALYADVADEVEAAVAWLLEQVVEAHIPLNELALLSADAEPYGSLLRERLAALPWSDDLEPTFVEGGVPLSARSDGARLVLTLRALREGLSRDALAALLPSLRGRAHENGGRSLPRAGELLENVGVLGGTRGDLKLGRQWPEAWESAVLRLEGESSAARDPSERARRRELQLELAELAPAVEALTDVLRHVLADAPLSILAMCLGAFAQRHLALPPSAPPAWVALEQAVSAFEGHEEHEPCGVAALDWLESMLGECAVTSGRFGMARVYLGTLEGARGLSFRAVRVLGLCEVADSGAPKQEPILSDGARASLSPLLVTSQQLGHRQLAAFDGALRSARERLVLSAPRVSRDGSPREPAALLLEVVRALVSPRNAHRLARLLEAASCDARAERQANKLSVAALSAKLPEALRMARATALAPYVDERIPHQRCVDARAGSDPTPRKQRDGRYGAAFGATVHRALTLLLGKRAGNPDGATRQAAREHALEQHLESALRDVVRSHDALRDGGLLEHPSWLAYPISGALAPDTLFSGYIDLLIATPRELIAIDFKSDASPRGDVETEYARDAAQVRAHARLLERSEAARGRAVRAALLFSADGVLRWL